MNDVRPCNVAKTQDGGFYLYDLGYASRWQGAQGRVASPSPPLPADGLYSSMTVLLGTPPGPMADLEALIYMAIVLSGHRLPWAADEGGFGAIILRADLMQAPEAASCISDWPPCMRTFACRTLRAAQLPRELQVESLPKVSAWLNELAS